MTSEFAIAVHALVYLNHKQETLASEELAKNVCTNPARIRKVMAKLKKKELIATKEGQNGGYHTSMKAADVNLAMIYDALEIEAVCASWKSGNPDMNCMVASGMADIMDDIYGQLNEVCREKLCRITIADIDNKIFHREERSMNMKKYDAVIIGFGKGGKTLAGKLAGQGKKVAMIEKDAGMYGGTCINVGCIPSKSLVRSSGLAFNKKEASPEERAADYEAAIDEKRRLTAMLREKNFRKLDDLDNVDVFNGTASFVSNTVVEVKTALETFEIEGEKIFINTGGTPVIPPIKGLRGIPMYIPVPH